MRFFSAGKSILFLILLLGIVFSILVLRFFNLIGPNSLEEIDYLIFMATASLAVIAYLEFNKSHTLTKNEFLIFISNRWASQETISARKIIHELFVIEYRQNNHSYEDSLKMIGSKIYEMSKSGGSYGEHFIDILVLLEFLETLGYFYKRNDLGKEDIINTCGNNIKFLFLALKEFIDNRRRHQPEDFKNFIYLFNEISKS